MINTLPLHEAKQILIYFICLLIVEINQNILENLDLSGVIFSLLLQKWLFELKATEKNFKVL